MCSAVAYIEVHFSPSNGLNPSSARACVGQQQQLGAPRHHSTSVSTTYGRYITLKNYLKYDNINIFKKTKRGYNHINVYFIGVYSFFENIL